MKTQPLLSRHRGSPSACEMWDLPVLTLKSLHGKQAGEESWDSVTFLPVGFTSDPRPRNKDLCSSTPLLVFTSRGDRMNIRYGGRWVSSQWSSVLSEI